MLAKSIGLITIAIFSLQIQLDAKQNDDDSAIRLGKSKSMQTNSGMAQSTPVAKVDKKQDVVVDLSEIDAAPKLQTKPSQAADPPAAIPIHDTEFGKGISLADPLNAPIGDSTEATPHWIRRTGLERWTRHPALAGAISIGIVLLGYGLMRMMGDRSPSRRPGRLPRQVIELVGFVPLSPRQQLQLVRLGSKLVLVAVSANGAEPLAEVTDPVEVDQILAACQSGQSALANAIGRWTGRQSPREHAHIGDRRGARALFEA